MEAFDDCGPASVVFSEQTTPGCPYDIIRTWAATDACGNITVAEQIISVEDTEAPFPVEVPPNQEIDCPPPCSECSFPPPPPVVFGDNCDPDPEIFVEVVTEGSLPGIARAQYFYQAVDNCGNASKVIVVEILMSCFKGDPAGPVAPGWMTGVASPSAVPGPLVRHLFPVWQDWGLSTPGQATPSSALVTQSHRWFASRGLGPSISAGFEAGFAHFQPIGSAPSGQRAQHAMATRAAIDWKVPGADVLGFSAGIGYLRSTQGTGITWPQLTGTLRLPLEGLGEIESSATWHLRPFKYNAFEGSSGFIWELRIRLGVAGSNAQVK